MELTRDQLLEMIDANGGNLNTVLIPIDSIPEGITVPGALRINAAGQIRRVPAIEVKTLIIVGGDHDNECTIEIASGFRAKRVEIECADAVNIVFGDDVHIAHRLRIIGCKRVTFGEGLFVGDSVLLDGIPGGVEFGRHLRIGQGIECSKYADPVPLKFSEESEVAFNYADLAASEKTSYPVLQFCQIDQLPTHSKFYCSIWPSSLLRVDEDAYIAGDLHLRHYDDHPIRFQHALRIDGCLHVWTEGGEIFIPAGSQLGDLEIQSDKSTYLRFGENVRIKDWQGIRMVELTNIPTGFRVDAGRVTGGASALTEVAADACLGDYVKLTGYPLKHWPIKDNLGDLHLTESAVQTLARGATIHGKLALNNSRIKELIDVTVEGDLVLNGSDIMDLVNVAVGGNLYVCNCPQLRSLDGVTVKGKIYIGGLTPTQIFRPEYFTACAGLVWDFEYDSDFRQPLGELHRLISSIDRPVRFTEYSSGLRLRLELQFD